MRVFILQSTELDVLDEKLLAEHQLTRFMHLLFKGWEQDANNHQPSAAWDTFEARVRRSVDESGETWDTVKGMPGPWVYIRQLQDAYRVPQGAVQGAQGGWERGHGRAALGAGIAWRRRGAPRARDRARAHLHCAPAHAQGGRVRRLLKPEQVEGSVKQWLGDTFT